jgi:hypothetical protein
MKLTCRQTCTAALNVYTGFGHGLSVAFTQMEVSKTETVLSQNHGSGYTAAQVLFRRHWRLSVAKQHSDHALNTVVMC